MLKIIKRADNVQRTLKIDGKHYERLDNIKNTLSNVNTMVI